MQGIVHVGQCRIQRHCSEKSQAADERCDAGANVHELSKSSEEGLEQKQAGKNGALHRRFPELAERKLENQHAWEYSKKPVEPDTINHAPAIAAGP